MGKSAFAFVGMTLTDAIGQSSTSQSVPKLELFGTLGSDGLDGNRNVRLNRAKGKPTKVNTLNFANTWNNFPIGHTGVP